MTEKLLTGMLSLNTNKTFHKDTELLSHLQRCLSTLVCAHAANSSLNFISFSYYGDVGLHPQILQTWPQERQAYALGTVPINWVGNNNFHKNDPIRMSKKNRKQISMIFSMEIL